MWRPSSRQFREESGELGEEKKAEIYRKSEEFTWKCLDVG
jgi:hypothetical protein